MTRRHVRSALCLAFAAMLAAGVQAADIDGAWTLVFQTQAGPRTMSLHVATDGDKATATLDETELLRNHLVGQALAGDPQREYMRAFEDELVAAGLVGPARVAVVPRP